MKSRAMRIGYWVVMACVLKSGGAVGGAEVPASTSVMSRDATAELVAKLGPSIAVIRPQGRDGQTMGVGTGFVIDSHGLIATAFHVIGESRPIVVEIRDGRTLPVKQILASDRQLDLAILQVDADNLPAISLSSQEPRAGQPAIALGHPLGLEHSVVSGMLSAVREVSGRSLIQVAMPIEPGHSGGPLIDPERGEVLGIVVMKTSGTDQLGFAVPVESLRRIWNQPNPVSMERWITLGRLDPARWSTRFGSDWRQVSGRILVEQPGDGFGGRSLCLATEVPAAPPFDVAVWVRLKDESGAAGLVFAADGQHRHFGFYPSDRKLRLTRFDGPTVFSWEILSETASTAYHPGEWNHLRVRVEPQKVTGYVNDQLVVESHDPRLQPGQIGLAKFRDTAAEFREFRVGPALPPALPTPEDRLQVERQLQALPSAAQQTSAQLEQLASLARVQPVLEQASHRMREEARGLERLTAAVHVESVCQAFAKWSATPDKDRRLLRGALLVSQLDNPDLDPDTYEAELDKMAQQVRTKSTGDGWSEIDRLQAMDQYLFEELGYHGSRTEYYHPANSYIDRVLDDREGLPITLSILYIELGKRLDLAIEGVGLPGHFIVRFKPTTGDTLLIDVFDRAKRWTREDAARAVQEFSEQEFVDEHLRPMEVPQIITRMLNNLIGIAQQRDDRSRLAGYLEAFVTLQPDNAPMRGMRAVVRREQGQVRRAIEDLDWILAHAPSGIDLDTVERMRVAFLAEMSGQIP